MYDANGNAIPIRWLAPECIEFDNDVAVTLRPITKECNLWLVHNYVYTYTNALHLKFSVLPCIICAD